MSSKQRTLSVHIDYCRGCGYGVRFRRVKRQLEEALPGVQISGTCAGTTTHEFEVKNVATGRLYHSKVSGEGHLDGNPDKLEAVKVALREDLEALSAPAPAPSSTSKFPPQTRPTKAAAANP